MIWSDFDIKKGLKEGSIKIDPWEEQALQPASVDLRLGEVFYRFRDHLPHPILDTKESVRDHMIRFEEKYSLVVLPQQFLLGSTKEKISLDDKTVARIEGKSSLARMGITVHSTGGFIDPGNKDLCITLEIVNHSPLPIRLHTGMWIAQVAFESLVTPCERPYGPERGSRYYADSEPVPSRVNEDLGLLGERLRGAESWLKGK